MRYIFPAKLIGSNHLSCRRLLIASWCVGLFWGVLCPGVSEIHTSWMRACLDSRVTIVGLLLVPLSPLLISAVAVYLSCPYLLCPLCFCKAFTFGLCAFAVASAYGSAGWLVQFLFMFTDCLTLPALCWFWIRHADGNKGSLRKDILCCTIWFLAIGIVDYRAVLPLLKEII